MPTAAIRDRLKLNWGYDELRPLQEPAIRCVLDSRDSIVVLPTGGGKSLCYQLPATVMDGLAVVVSPLISLMKDQVDALNANGISAACVNSAMTADERRDVWRELKQGLITLLYCAPERLAKPQFLDFLREAGVSFVAIDEAHCISEWGHDFRPDYLELATLREALPNIALHAFTATATPQVREDIATRLKLRDPEVIVGPFERLNLIYQVAPRTNLVEQVAKIVEDHPNESGVVYCISRKNVDELVLALQERGIGALGYHAGMSDSARKDSQDAFIQEQAEVIVATIAFGMGIDKSNVRFVIHAGMPKTLENYQQESGRAGRDGLEAHCHLLYSPRDMHTWRFIMKGDDEQVNTVGLEKLRQVEQFCTTPRCRHATLVSYFGQTLAKDNCGACDVCLGTVDTRDDGTELGKAIVACVLRLDERFGGGYTAAVLAGDDSEPRIAKNGHDRLPDYGALRSHGKRAVRDWIEQLVAQGHLEKTGDYGVLRVTGEGRMLLSGDGIGARLAQYHQKVAKSKPSGAADKSWVGVDRELFDKLRAKRRDMAGELGLPAYVILTDASLRDLARQKPRDREAMLACHGIGEVKATKFGAEFLAVIVAYTDGGGGGATMAAGPSAPAAPEKTHGIREQAFELLREELGVEEVARRLRVNERKAVDFLSAFLRYERRESPEPWVDSHTFGQIATLVDKTLERKPRRLAEAMGDAVTVATAEWCVICLDNQRDNANGYDS